MDFKKATDALFEPVAHADLAEALGISIASIRQARLDEDTKAHRSPPPGWRAAVIKLAEARARALQRLADQLKAAK